MSYDLKTWRVKQQAVIDWLSQELAGFHTGRATPALLDAIVVTAHNSKLPLKSLAAISVEDAKTLKVTPWDPAGVKDIESAIAAANLGVSTTPGPGEVRVIFPDLTGERRQTIAKAVTERLESAKVSLKKEREKAWQDIQVKVKAGDLSEDDKFRLKDELQKLVNEVAAELERLAERKRQEIGA